MSLSTLLGRAARCVGSAQIPSACQPYRYPGPCWDRGTATSRPATPDEGSIESRKREHSRKPDEQYDLIEDCSPGPYLELFARWPREGWTVWGDEADATIEPRGRAHKGYEGGPLRVPHIDRSVRLPDDVAEIVAKKLRLRYEAGSSIRQLADEAGYTITRVRSLLVRAGTDFRSRGRTASDDAG